MNEILFRRQLGTLQKSRFLLRRGLWPAAHRVSLVATATSDSLPRYNETRRFASSVSSEEVSKFSAMDDMWWDPLRHPLVAMNPVRVRYIVDMLHKFGSLDAAPEEKESQPLSGLRALDVGCGGGLLSESLARLGSHVTAIDPSTALVERAKEHAKLDVLTQAIDYQGGVSVEVLASRLSNDDDKFDVICILEVIEHVTHVDSLLQAASSLLKPNGGVLFVSTVNRTWKSHLLAIAGAEYIMGYIPVGTHDWNLFRSPKEVSALMGKASLQPVDVSGMILTTPPFDGKWRWQLNERDTDVNWIGAYRHAK